MTEPAYPDCRFLARSDFNQLLGALQELGYRCMGPRLCNGAIVYDSLEHADQLPVGISVEQSPGSYRVHPSDSVRAFAWSNGPQALKPLVNATRETLWSANRFRCENHCGLASSNRIPEPAANNYGRFAMPSARPKQQARSSKRSRSVDSEEACDRPA